jgi:hypothetical protein
MEWSQALTIILTILTGTVGSTYIFYMITEKRIDKMDAALIRMDEKWERLFEKLLLKEQGKGG